MAVPGFWLLSFEASELDGLIIGASGMVFNAFWLSFLLSRALIIRSLNAGISLFNSVPIRSGIPATNS